jgi:hypothetical protein
MRSITKWALAAILVLGGLGGLGAPPAQAGGYRGGFPYGGGFRGTPFYSGGTFGGGFPGGVGYRGFSYGGPFSRGGYGFNRFPNVGPFPPFPTPGRPAYCGPRRSW